MARGSRAAPPRPSEGPPPTLPCVAVLRGHTGRGIWRAAVVASGDEAGDGGDPLIATAGADGGVALWRLADHIGEEGGGGEGGRGRGRSARPVPAPPAAGGPACSVSCLTTRPGDPSTLLVGTRDGGAWTVRLGEFCGDGGTDAWSPLLRPNPDAGGVLCLASLPCASAPAPPPWLAALPAFTCPACGDTASLVAAAPRPRAGGPGVRRLCRRRPPHHAHHHRRRLLAGRPAPRLPGRDVPAPARSVPALPGRPGPADLLRGGGCGRVGAAAAGDGGGRPASPPGRGGPAPAQAQEGGGRLCAGGRPVSLLRVLLPPPGGRGHGRCDPVRPARPRGGTGRGRGGAGRAVHHHHARRGPGGHAAPAVVASCCLPSWLLLLLPPSHRCGRRGGPHDDLSHRVRPWPPPGSRRHGAGAGPGGGRRGRGGGRGRPRHPRLPGPGRRGRGGGGLPAAAAAARIIGRCAPRPGPHQGGPARGVRRRRGPALVPRDGRGRRGRGARRGGLCVRPAPRSRESPPAPGRPRVEWPEAGSLLLLLPLPLPLLLLLAARLARGGAAPRFQGARGVAAAGARGRRGGRRWGRAPAAGRRPQRGRGRGRLRAVVVPGGPPSPTSSAPGSILLGRLVDGAARGPWRPAPGPGGAGAQEEKEKAAAARGSSSRRARARP